MHPNTRRDALEAEQELRRKFSQRFYDAKEEKKECEIRLKERRMAHDEEIKMSRERDGKLHREIGGMEKQLKEKDHQIESLMREIVTVRQDSAKKSRPSGDEPSGSEKKQRR